MIIFLDLLLKPYEILADRSDEANQKVKHRRIILNNPHKCVNYRGHKSKKRI